MKVLGIETSCDETAAAVVQDGNHLLSSVIASSVDLHVAYGGVVPEIAARSHIEVIEPVIAKALAQANTDWAQLDAIAVTYGPGLGGSLLIGVLTARTLAIAKNKPLYGVNHVEAHPYAAFLTSTSLPGYTLPTSTPKFPILSLIISGGHTQSVLFSDHFTYEILGQTADDAVGEAFDKVAKMLGLPYPGGPSVAKAALTGNPLAFKFPKARLSSPYSFSFSGLKTAVLRAAQSTVGSDYTLPSTQLPKMLNASQKTDIAASFQMVAIDTLADSLETAAKQYNPASIVIAGGVAANAQLRAVMNSRLKPQPIYPDIKLCTDNAAMIATLGYFQASNKRPPADPYSLEISPNLSM